MDNLKEGIKEQTTDLATRMQETEFLNTAPNSMPLDNSLKSLLELQKDSMTTIDASRFSTLHQPAEESPLNLKELVRQAKKDAPKMLKKGAKSGAKRLLRKVPLGDGVIDAVDILIEERFKKRGWIRAGQVIVADAAEEVPFAGGALNHLIRNVKLVKDKNQDAPEICLDGIVKDAKREVPKIARNIAKNELKKSLRELPLVDGLFNAGDALVKDGVKKRGLIRASQAIAADAAGEIPLVGSAAESLIKKIRLTKSKEAAELQTLEENTIVDEVYFVKRNEDNQMQSEGAVVSSNNGKEMSAKLAPLQMSSNISQHLRQLRGQESGVEKCVIKKTTLNKNYVHTASLSR